MNEKQKQIEDLKQKIRIAERGLETAKQALFELTGGRISGLSNYLQLEPSGEEVIQGRFDGENMISDTGKTYPVPANYASKSKLVEGDILKLTIANDGSFIFKQIKPIKRERVIATLGFSDNAYYAEHNGKNYKLLYASITYHKAKPTDRVAISIPANGTGSWAALENVLHNKEEEDAFIESTKHLNDKLNEIPKKTEASNPKSVTENPVSPLKDFEVENVENLQEEISIDNPTTTEKVIKSSLEENDPKICSEDQKKPDVLGVSDIKIESLKAPPPQAVKPEPVQNVTPATHVHPLEAENASAQTTNSQEDKPVQELDI